MRRYFMACFFFFYFEKKKKGQLLCEMQNHGSWEKLLQHFLGYHCQYLETVSTKNIILDSVILLQIWGFLNLMKNILYKKYFIHFIALLSSISKIYDFWDLEDDYENNWKSQRIVFRWVLLKFIFYFIGGFLVLAKGWCFYWNNFTKN